MSDISLGTLSAAVRLDTSGLSEDAQRAKALLAELSEGIGAQTGSIRSSVSALGQDMVDSLGRSLQKGVKGTLSALLTETLKEALSEALDAAIASVFGRKKRRRGGLGGIFGGPGGIVGDLLGVGLGFLGFDDAGNDAKARRWGYDFAAMFSRGAQQYTRSVNSASREQTGAQNVSVQVTLTGDHHYHHEMDARRIGEVIAFHAQHMLRVKVGG